MLNHLFAMPTVPATPEKMTALRFVEGQLTPATVSTPAPHAGEVLVRVCAAGVNPVDLKARFNGALYSTGVDGVGHVYSVGEGVTIEWIGQRVMWHGSLLQMRSGRPESGSYNQYAVIQADALVRVPSEIPDSIAATIPCPGGTAQQIVDGLAPVIEARGPETSAIFIQSASGSVGRLTVQLLTHRYPSLLVVGSASEQHHADLSAIGVTAISYRSPTNSSSSFEFEQMQSVVAERSRDLVGIVNFMGGGSLQQHYEYLGPDEVLVSVLGGQRPQNEREHGPAVHIIALGKAYDVEADPSVGPSIPAYAGVSHPVREMRNAYQSITDHIASGAIQSSVPQLITADTLCQLTIDTLVGKPVMIIN